MYRKVSEEREMGKGYGKKVDERVDYVELPKFSPIYNRRLGKRMRFCEVCSVSMGFSTREKYVERFIQGHGLCPICGKPAVMPQGGC